jgi:bacillithiol biosynthesis deacetylase BshB1
LKHHALGYKIGVVDLTKGELGTRGSAELREQEANAAFKLMGFEVRENLELKDGFFTIDETTLLKVVSIIRKYQPDIVFATAINDRHPDHGRAAKLISDAFFLCGLSKVKTQINEVQQNAWKPTTLYHYIQDHLIKPDLVVDISDYLEKKLEVIRAYRSQFYDPSSQEPETSISKKDFLEFIKARAKDFGRPIGAEYGEGFTANRFIGVKDLFHLM